MGADGSWIGECCGPWRQGDFPHDVSLPMSNSTWNLESTNQSRLFVGFHDVCFSWCQYSHGICELILVGKVQGTGCIMYHLFPKSC